MAMSSPHSLSAAISFDFRFRLPEWTARTKVASSRALRHVPTIRTVDICLQNKAKRNKTKPTFLYIFFFRHHPRSRFQRSWSKKKTNKQKLSVQRGERKTRNGPGDPEKQKKKKNNKKKREETANALIDRPAVRLHLAAFPTNKGPRVRNYRVFYCPPLLPCEEVEFIGFS